MALTYDSLTAFINGLNTDGGLTAADYNQIILYILANGDLANSPRDLMQIRRGNLADLPTLAQGELALCLDTEEVFVGGSSANIKVSGKTADKYLFISDSYDQYGSWISKTASIMGLASGTDYWNIAAPSTSMSSGTWLGLLQTWVAAHPNDIKSIGTIVCGGGINDSDSTNFPLLANAMTAFGNYCKTTFGSDVHVKLAFFGWALDTSSILNGRTANYRMAVQELYGRAEGYGMEYIPGCEMVLHNRTLLDVDGLHPNADGGQRIAECVSNGLKNGYASVTSYATTTLIPVSGTASGSVSQSVANGQVVTYFESLVVNGTNLTFANNAFTKIGDIHLPLGNKIPETPVRIMLQTAGGNVSYDAYVRILNDALEARIYQIDGGSFVTATATVFQAFSLTISNAGIRD
jgi:hypothetical protein